MGKSLYSTHDNVDCLVDLSCIASYPFNEHVTTWRRPSTFQVCVISREKIP